MKECGSAEKFVIGESIDSKFAVAGAWIFSGEDRAG
jgi:hypothetical protein